jgi:hypothetical protein
MGPGWPRPEQLEHYFLGPLEQRWPFENGQDCLGFSALGADGTEQLPEGKGRIDIRLTMVGNLDHGVLLHYRKAGGARDESYYSRVDLGRLREWVKTKDGDLMPIGFFIPYEMAWKAVKEFIETDGTLPTSIAWIAGRDIPDYAFPDPAERYSAEE